MRILMQGASKKLSIVLKSDQLVVQDPDKAENIMLELYHENGNKRLALYGTDVPTMDALGFEYGVAYIDGNYVDFYIDGVTTEDFPPGRIVGRFTITYTNVLFPLSGVQTIKGRGVIFNIIL